MAPLKDASTNLRQTVAALERKLEGCAKEVMRRRRSEPRRANFCVPLPARPPPSQVVFEAIVTNGALWEADFSAVARCCTWWRDLADSPAPDAVGYFARPADLTH